MRRLLTALLLCLSLSASAEPWPRAGSPWPHDPAMEARIDALLARMSLAQKVGQMTQPEIRAISAEDVRRHAIGSVLNGGGGWPDQRKHSGAADWLRLARALDAAALEGSGGIPLIWGLDAMHGHSNVYGATLFPHNIGLGAVGDAALVREIGRATARSVRATGIAWTFAPTVAVVKDLRWGRTYESYGQDPQQVARLGAALTEGLQEGLGQGRGVVATAKHFIGDGGTRHGRDQGETFATDRELRRTHAPGYYSTLRAGALTVMASFNSWAEPDGQPRKLHGHELLLTQRLKQEMGFDGLLVSDWDGIGQVPGCRPDACAAAINAGIDLVMVPFQWKRFLAHTIAQVERGEIPMARIDDAVRRILRVKLRAGLFEHPPSRDADAGNPDLLVHRALARRAAAATQVLLKNDGGLLPLPRSHRLLVVGKSADSLQNQTGGWSLTWQGTENRNSDFPVGQSLLGALREALGETQIQHRPDAAGLADVDWSRVDTVVAVIGETPYAEGVGDIPGSGTLRHSSRHPEDLQLLEALRTRGKPVATVFISGRPVWVNDLLNRSQAFVAAWLPGTEGAGMADVLLANGAPFSARLSFDWPAEVCPRSRARPLFALGHGLRSGQASRPRRHSERVPVGGCEARTELGVFERVGLDGHALYVPGPGSFEPLGNDLTAALHLPSTGTPQLALSTMDLHTQHDAKRVRWLDQGGRLIAWSLQSAMLTSFPDAALVLDLQLFTPPDGPVWLGMGCGPECQARVDIGPWLLQGPRDQVRTLRLPVACLSQLGLKAERVDAPFLLEADAPLDLAFTRVKVQAGAARHPQALPCPISR